LEHIKENPLASIKKLRHKISSNFGIQISLGHIYWILRHNNLTYKKIQKNNYPYSQEKFNLFKNKLKDNITNCKRNYVSIDETQIILNRKRSDYGISEKGKRCTVRCSNKKEIRFSVVMAISKSRLIAYKITKGSFNGEKFKDFIVNDVLSRVKKSKLLMDNARIHHYKGLKNYMLANNITNDIIYNVPYCPQYNPIEYVFNTIKASIRRNSIPAEKDLHSFIKGFFHQNKESLKKYFNKSYSCLFN